MASRTIWRVITTVFITLCSKRVPVEKQRCRAFERALLGLLACWMLVLAPQARAEAPVTEIAQLRLERSEDGILLSAYVKFELPPIIDDALDKGIPMFFVAEAVLYRDRWYWYDKRVAAAARHMRL